MQVRRNDNSPESIEYEAFKKQIISGDIGPDTHVRDRVLTDDQWMSADNLGIFHKMSPSKHPHGRILKQKLRQEARRMQQRQKIAAKLKEYAAVRTFIEDSYER